MTFCEETAFRKNKYQTSKKVMLKETSVVFGKGRLTIEDINDIANGKHLSQLNDNV